MKKIIFVLLIMFTEHSFAQTVEQAPIPYGTELSSGIIEMTGDKFRTLFLSGKPTLLQKEQLIRIDAGFVPTKLPNVILLTRKEDSAFMCNLPSNRILHDVFIKNSYGYWELVAIEENPVVVTSATTDVVTYLRKDKEVTLTKMRIENTQEYWWKPSDIGF